MSSTIEEYTFGWEKHGSNFSFTFNDILQSNELVDVQLVAEGHLISAHRLVLSAMSPYFRKMFTQMPVDQQTFGKLYFYSNFMSEMIQHSMNPKMKFRISTILLNQPIFNIKVSGVRLNQLHIHYQ